MADTGDKGPDAPEARQAGIYRLVIAAHMLDVAAPSLADRSPLAPSPGRRWRTAWPTPG